MATNSSEAGFLAPSAAAPYDIELDDILFGVIVGLTGLRGDFVRPKWQVEPSQRPGFEVNWCSFGLVNSVVDSFAYEHHDGAGQGSTTIERDELLYFRHSFHGPNSHGIAERFRDGFEVSQNRDSLRLAGLALVEVQEARKIPTLLQERWVPKVEVTVVYRRRTSRTYPILNIESAHGSIQFDDLNVSITVNQ